MRMNVACALIAPLLFAACTSDLTRQEATEKVRDHLFAAGSNRAEYLIDMDVTVETILKPNDAMRTVRFRTFSTTDTSDVHEMTLTRSDEGWEITGYGPNTIGLVAGIVWGYRFDLYLDLLDPLSHLQAVVNKWQFEGSGDLLYRLDHALPRHEMEGLVNAESVPVDRFTWGVYPDDDPVLIWVRDIDNPTRVCVEPFDDDFDYILSPEFDWVEGGEFDQCTGDEASYSMLMFDDLELEIVLIGGVWLN